jgi:argininosuccinate lyase
MAHQDVLIQVKVVSDQEARHVQKALQSIADNFKAQELVVISKKLEIPLVKLKIKSML